MPLRKILFVMVTIIATIFYSCKEAPRNFNSTLLGPDQINLVNLDSFVGGLPQNSNSFKTVIATGSSLTLLLGNYSVTPGNNQDASILLQFNYSTIPDSDKADILNGSAAVIDSWVAFTKTYAIGDTNATQIDFGAYKVNTPWTASGFTSDSLNNFSYNNTDLSSQKKLTDSTKIFTFHLNPGAIQSQITNYANGVQDNGIYLKPNYSGNTVWGFGAISSSYPPALVVVLSKIGVYADTLYFNALADVSVLSGNIPTPSQDIIAQSSLVGQSKIFFDVTSIPSNSIINQAKLLLTIDRSQTVNGTVFTPSLASYNIADSAGKITDSTLAYSTITQTDSLTYEGDVTSFVQKWVTKKNNQGLLITPLDGLNGMDIFAFKGSNASNQLQRPRLIILYTKK